MHGGCVIHENELPSETLVLKHCNEINTRPTDRSFSAVVSESINVSSPRISHHCSSSNQSSSIDVTAELPHLTSGSVYENNHLTVSEPSALQKSTPPCDRLSDIHLLEDRASSNVSMCVTETGTKPLFNDCCIVDISSRADSCNSESSVANDLHSLPVSSINSTVSSTIGLKICDSILPEIDRIHLEAGKSMLEVNSSHCVLEKHYAPTGISSPTSVCFTPQCVLPNVSVATDSSQNGLSVGNIVSCFKSVTAMSKSQKAAHHIGQLYVYLSNCDSIAWDRLYCKIPVSSLSVYLSAL